MSVIISEKIPKFFLQWHLTAKCDLNCKHCYIKDKKTYENELKNELNKEECFKVIDDFVDTLDKWKLQGRIHFTGGDPLLRKDIFEILNHAKEKDIEVSILGNSTHIDEETVRKLDEIGVYRYQISIDGDEISHDEFRGKKGSFEDSIRAIKLIKERSNIIPTVMTTISKENIRYLNYIINMSVQAGAKLIAFARLVPFGSGEQLKEQIISTEEYKGVFEMLESRQKELKNKIIIGEKDPLWTLFNYENGSFKPQRCGDCTVGGCSMGWTGLSILADGTVYPCRRLPIKIGKVPEESIRKIFVESEILNKVRDASNIEKCSTCELKSYCRGCRAVAYALTGNFLAADPQCWKK